MWNKNVLTIKKNLRPARKIFWEKITVKGFMPENLVKSRQLYLFRNISVMAESSLKLQPEEIS